MKILLLSEFFPAKNDGVISGGVESRTYYLAKELAKRGHDVAVVAAFLSSTKREEIWDGVKIYRVGNQYSYVQSGSNFRRLSFALSSIIKIADLKYDVIDANNTAVYLAAIVGGWLSRARVVYWVPDVMGLAKWWRAFGPATGTLNEINEILGSLPLAHAAIALSQTTKEKLKPFCWPEKKLYVIYPGVKVFRPSRAAKVGNRIVVVNRLTEYKRTDLVIKAVGILKRQGIKISCEIVGTGEQLPALKKLAKKHQVGPKIKFWENLPHEKVFQIFRRATIFCLPSEIEGFGIVTLEAMTAGLPFVNSDIPVHQEIARASQAGVLFKSGDPKDLAAKIKMLLENKKEYRRLSKNALSFAKNYSLSKMVSKTEKVYLNL